MIGSAKVSEKAASHATVNVNWFDFSGTEKRKKSSEVF
jgi:hypothetical protein